MTCHVIVGTAGHIDHGKTALVKALTGVDADRLPEEKRRGMTVDLGFASLELEELRLGIVDVPGHDRFIRNMLCGALAVDVAMLVIAATESIKPQTREHLEILKHTGIEQGVVVLSKCDLADELWIELVEEEVRELIDPTFLQAAPLIRVSVTSGAGIAELRQELAVAARRAANSSRRALIDAPFSMGVDRAFSVDGHGTVVTGSVASGRLRLGDEVVIQPSGTAARVRGLQSHNAAVEVVERGQRAAINLAGVALQSIRRGDVLACDGFVSASRSFGARITIAAEHRARVRQKMPVRVHLGTAEVQATLRMLERPRDGEEVLVELLPSETVACIAGQPLVIRSHCATMTLGGGRVLDPELPAGRRWSATDLLHFRRLASCDPADRLAASIYLNAVAGFEQRSVVRRGGSSPPPASAIDSLVERREVARFDLPGEQHHYLHAQVVDRLIDRIEQLLEKQHQRNPLRAAFPRSALHKIFTPDAPVGLRDAIIRRMEQAGRLVTMPAGIALPGHVPQLSKAQQREYARIIQLHREARCAPPSTDQLIAGAKSHRDAVPKLIELAVAEGHLLRVGADWCLHWETERQVLETLRNQMGEIPFAVSDLRELLHTSRKYLVPLCEYLDRIGFTERDGNLRTIARRDPQLREECCT